MTKEKLIQELSDTKKGLKKLKFRTIILKDQLKEYKHHLRVMAEQYEHVIDAYKAVLERYKNNINKMFFLSVFQKIKNKFGGDK